MSYKDITYQREYQRRWIAKRRAEYFKNKKCSVCGSTKNLELDHIDPTKKVSHRIWSWSKKRRDLELAKCQVLCEDHHKERSSQQKHHPVVHGTLSGYHYYKCRCNECCWKHKEEMRLYRLQ